MKTIALDGLYMTTKEATHAYLRWRLQAPDYYGCNLDALHDILTDPCEPTHLILYRKDLMLKADFRSKDFMYLISFRLLRSKGDGILKIYVFANSRKSSKSLGESELTFSIVYLSHSTRLLLRLS